MSGIKLLAKTNDTITMSRDDFEKLLDELEDAEDFVAIAKHDLQTLAAGGWERHKLSGVNGEEMRRLFDGVHPLIVWREKRGLTQRALAEKAGTSPGYLSEIEARKKPGSLSTMAALARALDISIDDLVDAVPVAEDNSKQGSASLLW